MPKLSLFGNSSDYALKKGFCFYGNNFDSIIFGTKLCF